MPTAATPATPRVPSRDITKWNTQITNTTTLDQDCQILQKHLNNKVLSQISVFTCAWASIVSLLLIFCNRFAHKISIINITTVCLAQSHYVCVRACVFLFLGAMKCPQCEFVYSTKWELNRHLKNKHCLKVVEGTWEVNSVYITDWLPRGKSCFEPSLQWSLRNPVIKMLLFAYPGERNSGSSRCSSGGWGGYVRSTCASRTGQW